MFCPECGLEFEEGFVQCEDCEVRLVDDPPEEVVEVGEFQRLVEVADVADFAAVTARLEEAGIAWFVQSEERPGVVIYVSEKRLVEALGMLETAIQTGAQS